MASASATQTFTVSSSDVRTVLGLMRRETFAICNSMPSLPLDFNVEETWKDISVLAMYDFIESVQLQIYVGDQLKREYRFVFCSTPQSAYGPSSDNPPTATVPSGARMRLSVIRNPAQSDQEMDSMFRSLKWKTAAPLKRPAESDPSPYGAFASGGYSVERQYWKE